MLGFGQNRPLTMIYFVTSWEWSRSGALNGSIDFFSRGSRRFCDVAHDRSEISSTGFMKNKSPSLALLGPGYHQRAAMRRGSGLNCGRGGQEWGVQVNRGMTCDTVNVGHSCIFGLFSVTLSQSPPSSLLPDFQPLLPVRPLGLQTGALAAASLPQIATIRHFPLSALPSGRRPLHAHR